MAKFLTKVKRYGLVGAESVLASYETEDEAHAHADRWNTDYQTDTAYAEEWDEAKFDWPQTHGWEGTLDE